MKHTKPWRRGKSASCMDIAKRLLSSGAAAQNDWGRPMAYTRQFGSNFFAQAGAELREAYEAMMAEAQSKGQEPSDFLKWTKARYGYLSDFTDEDSLMDKSGHDARAA